MTPSIIKMIITDICNAQDRSCCDQTRFEIQIFCRIIHNSVCLLPYSYKMVDGRNTLCSILDCAIKIFYSIY